MQEEFENFYQDNLTRFGDSAQGVGWKNIDAQRIRFEQLFKVITQPNKGFSLNDLGCGVGDFVDFLQSHKCVFDYHGYDVLAEMITRAREKRKQQTDATFHVIKNADDMMLADYTVASGIFNIRFGNNDEEWLRYILDTITAMDKKSIFGFAFNILTKYSDAEYMKKELYYADPSLLFDFCKRNFSRNVALLHDYDQYDFTIIVRKKNQP